MELVGKVAQVTSLPHKSTLGAFISLLRPSTEVDAKLYYYQLTSSDVQSEIRRYASTTTNISNISSSRLAEIPLSVPPLPEQHRIVAEIEKQFTRLGASVTALKRVQANLKRYRASVLRAACEGKLVPTEAELARLEGRGYEPAAQLLERILCERRAHVVHFTSAFYILTSNKGFGEWGEFLGTASSPRPSSTVCCTTATCSTSGGELQAAGERQAGLFPSQQHLPSRLDTAPIVPTTDRIAEHLTGHFRWTSTALTWQSAARTRNGVW